MRVKKRDELVIPTRGGRQLYIVMCVCHHNANQKGPSSAQQAEGTNHHVQRHKNLPYLRFISGRVNLLPHCEYLLELTGGVLIGERYRLLPGSARRDCTMVRLYHG